MLLQPAVKTGVAGKVKKFICVLLFFRVFQDFFFQCPGFHNFKRLVPSSSRNLSCSYSYSPCNRSWNLLVSLYFSILLFIDLYSA